MILFDGNTGADNIAKTLERLKKIFMRPFVSETFDEDISFCLHTP